MIENNITIGHTKASVAIQVGGAIALISPEKAHDIIRGIKAAIKEARKCSHQNNSSK